MKSLKNSKAALRRWKYAREKQLKYYDDCIDALNKAETVEELEGLKTGYFVDHIEEIASTVYADERGFEYDGVKRICNDLLDDCRKRVDAKINRIKSEV